MRGPQRRPATPHKGTKMKTYATAREVRDATTTKATQTLTVKELRHLLFELDDQAMPVEIVISAGGGSESATGEFYFAIANGKLQIRPM